MNVGERDRYFISENRKERQVSRSQFILAERACGFFPKSDDPNALATGGFTHTVLEKNGKTITGRIERR